MELRTALFIVGMIIIVVIGVLSYRKIKQGQSGGRARSASPFSHQWADDNIDPLFEPPRTGRSRAPAVDSAGPVATEAPVTSGSESVKPRQEPVLESPPEQADDIGVVLPAPPSEPKPQTLDLDLEPAARNEDIRPEKTIDYVALIRGAEPIRRDQALSVYRQHEYKMDKPSFIYGFNIGSGLWRNLEKEPSTGEYRDICLAIQLVDGNGAVSDSELHRFSQMSLEVAEELQRPIIFSLDHDEALAYAHDLDRFCADVDIYIIVSLVARSDRGFAMRAIGREAERLGLIHTTEKVYRRERVDAEGRVEVQFTLANMYKPGELPQDDAEAHTDGLTLFMRLAVVHDPVEVFSDMIESAALLAKRLNGIVVDQERNPLTEEGIAAIHRRVGKYSRRLEQRGISPGGTIARRLF